MVVGRVDLRLGEAQVPQEVEARVVELSSRDAKRAGAELLAKRPLVEDEADVEGWGSAASIFSISAGPKPWPISAVWLMPARSRDCGDPRHRR
jgi:hypothetical protein